MNILYAADNNFARILSVSIYSLLEQHLGQEMNIFILNDDIGNDNIKTIKNLFKESNHQVVFIEKRNTVDTIVSDRGSNTQFLRLYFDEYLPNDIDRLLYLDCDTLIESSLLDLYETDLQGKTLMLAKDPFSKNYRKFLGLSKNAEMFNSGVMLIDCRVWLQEQFPQRIKEVINKYKGHIIQGDQGIIDVVVQNSFSILNPKYNMISSYNEFTYKELMVYRKPVNYYSENCVKKAIENPIIVHLTSDFFNSRPWIKYSESKYRDEWQAIEKKIFGNNIVISKKGQLKKIFNVLPRKVAVQAFGILQAYIRPALLKIKGY